jgi:hypothetical protein
MTMSGKSRVVAVVIAAAVIAAIAVLRTPRRNAGQAAGATVVSSSVPMQKTANAPARDRPMIERLVPKQSPRTRQKSTFTVAAPANELDRVVAELKPVAAAGDPAAMRMLGETLDRCAHPDMRSDHEIEVAAARQSLDMEFMNKKGIVTVMEGETDPTRSAAKMVASMKQLRDSCAKISNEDLDVRRDWLEKAAAAGDPQARWPLVGDLIKQMKDPDLLAEQREQLEAQWMDLLQQNIADGFCTNMELNLFMQNSHDPIVVFIYGSMLMRRGIAAIDTLPPERREPELATLRRQEKIYAAAVPEEQLRAAEATRDYIAANYCNNFP